MRAAYIESFGSASVIQVGKFLLPKRKSGEALVKMVATTLNHRDIYLRRGEAGRVNLPVVLGSDGSGIVVEIDDNLGFNAGDRVAIYPVLSCGSCLNCLNHNQHKCCHQFGMIGGERNGTHAEFVLVPSECLVKIPDQLDDHDAAALSLAGVTALNMVREEAAVGAGDHALVYGASGGVGVFVIKLLKKIGAHVHVVTSSPHKLKFFRALGVETIFDESPLELLRFTRSLPNGGVDVLFNCVGGSTWRCALPATRVGGRIVVCGTIRSSIAELDMRQIFYRNLSIIGASMGSKKALEDMLLLAANDTSLRAVISSNIELSHINEAHSQLERGEASGKIVICF